MPVTTRRQAEQAMQAHVQSHLNLNNLPAEIIQAIADHLAPDREDPDETEDPAELDDFDDDMSFFSANSQDDPPEIKVMPCCRPGDEKVGAGEPRIPVLDERSTFSATSKRIRDVVWNRRRRSRRTIRYCDQWIQETMLVSEETRSRYTKLNISGNERHVVKHYGGNLIPRLQCFPNVEDLAISWSLLNLSLTATHSPVKGLPRLRRFQIIMEPRFRAGPNFVELTMRELLSLFHHLPLKDVESFGLIFKELSVKSELQGHLEMLYHTIGASRFKALKTVHLSLELGVYDRPSIDLWAMIMKGLFQPFIESVVKATGITDVFLVTRLVFDCNAEVMSEGFTQTEDGVRLHPAFLPSSDILVAWARRLKACHSRLRSFKLVIEYDTVEVDVEDFPEDNEILQFEYRETKEDEDVHRQIINRLDKDPHSQPSGADDDRFRYQVYPDLVTACYDQLVKDAEALSQQEAFRATNMPAGLLADNEAAGAPNREDGAD